ADDTVDRALAGPVAVVEQVLGVGVVHGDDRELQHFLFGHASEPDDAGGGFFRAADHVFEQVFALGMDQRDDIGPIVHRDLRFVADRRLYVLVVGLAVFALDREGRNAVMFDQRRRDLILCAQGVGGAETDIGSTGLERFHQIGG